MDKLLEAFAQVAPYLTNPLVLIGFALLLVFSIHRTLIRSGIIPPVGPRVGGRIVQTLLRYGFVLAVLLTLLGFGLWFYKTHRETGPPVDVNAIIETLQVSHREQLATRERETEDWKQQARAAVEALANLRTQRDAPPNIDQALALLEKGDTQAAETIFQKIEQSKAAEGEAANKQAAEAARHLGALAYLNDTQKALDAYRRATKLDPDNAQGWNQLGHLLDRTGELSEAEEAYQRVLALGQAADDSTWLAVAYGNLGIIYQTRGELDQAEAMYKKSLELFQEIGAEPQIAQVQGLIDSLR